MKDYSIDHDPAFDYLDDEWNPMENDGDDPELMEAFAHAIAKEDPPPKTPYRTMEEEDRAALEEYGEGIKEEQEFNRLVAEDFFKGKLK